MQVESRSFDVLGEGCDLLILWGFEQEEPLDGIGSEVDNASDGLISAAVAANQFQGKAGETLVVHLPGALPVKRAVVVGLGEAKDLGEERLREAGGAAAKEARGANATEACMTLPPLSHDLTAAGIEALTVGFLLALYRYPKQSTRPETDPAPALERLTVLVSDGPNETAAKVVASGRIIAEAAAWTRTWVNHPGNVAHADALQSAVQEIADRTEMTLTVHDAEDLRKEEMGLLLAVGKGASVAPRMLELEYCPAQIEGKDEAPIVLIGKGILFDTGGYTLKSPPGMFGMNSDMAGSAVVLGAMQAIAQLKLPVRVIALTPLVENLIGPDAYKPNDVYYGKNGMSVEIRSADAEGRLALADALCYADQLAPRTVIDVATLTGGKQATFGSRFNALFSSDDDLASALIEAGQRAGELLWRMPLDPAYDRQIRSPVADLVNSGGKTSSTITAARFLAHFAGEWPWSHIDIAGSSTYGGGPEYTPRSYMVNGATAIPMRTLVEYVRSQA